LKSEEILYFGNKNNLVTIQLSVKRKV